MIDFSRSQALLGKRAMARLAAAKVLLVGCGGVGGWCAEALVRTGVGHLTLVDDDKVAPSNLNRQCPATSGNIGKVKVEAMRERLISINPGAEITALDRRYPACGDRPDLKGFDVVIDAIDSVDCKARLILDALDSSVPVISSMGAALRFDPSAVRVSRFEKVEGDGLAKALRRRFKLLGVRPGRFPAVWSTEMPYRTECAVKGSLMQVVAVFGVTLASECIKMLTAGCDGRQVVMAT
jgi:tRNA A37 threonylcarbamoyladenosine dehydratase